MKGKNRKIQIKQKTQKIKQRIHKRLPRDSSLEGARAQISRTSGILGFGGNDAADKGPGKRGVNAVCPQGGEGRGTPTRETEQRNLGGAPGGGLITLGSLQARPRAWVLYSRGWLRKSSRQGDE